MVDERGDTGLADQMGHAVYVVDPERRITYWNGAAEQLTGYPASAVVGRRCGSALLGHVGEDGVPLCGPRCPLDATIRDGRTREVAATLCTSTGGSVAVHIRASALREAGSIVGAVEVFRDDTAGWAARRLIEDLEALVVTDPLTGGGNRRALDRACERAFSRFEATGQRFGLIVIDIDAFKTVNDRYGHGVGDDVLRQVAQRLEACVRAGDVVARLGGDEFGVVTGPIGPAELAELVHRIGAAATRAPFRVAGEMLTIEVSVGGCVVAPGDDGPALLARADDAMYESKGVAQGDRPARAHSRSAPAPR